MRPLIERLDRLDTITRYLRLLIGSVNEELMVISESVTEGSAHARAVADAFDATAMAIEYLSEAERLQ